MKHLVKMDDLLNEGFGFGKNFINKAIEFIEKIKDLFNEIILQEKEIREVFDSPSLNLAIMKNKGYYKQIKDIYNDNKERVNMAYNEVFGVKEQFCGILISVAVCFFIYYAIQKGWADKVIRKFDPNFKGQNGYPGDDWKKSKRVERKPVPKLYKSKEQRMDEILDKAAKGGYNRLSDEEKRFLQNNK